MRVILIDPIEQVAQEATILMPSETMGMHDQIRLLMNWRKPAAYRYRRHWLWVDDRTVGGPAFTLTEGETTLGPFHGQGWIVAENAHGELADISLRVEEVTVNWAPV